MHFRIVVIVVDLWDPTECIYFIAMTLLQNMLYYRPGGGR